MTAKLLVVGDAVTDVVAAPHGPLNPGTDTSARIRTLPGGSGANTAAWAGSRGCDTVLLAKVGADDAQWHRTALQEAGVRPELAVSHEQPSAVVLAIVDAYAERTMITDRGAAGLLGSLDWKSALLDGVSRVHLSGYVWFSAPGRELAATVLADCAARAVPVSLDPASTGFIAEYGVDRFSSDIADADLLLPNLDEARLLSGENDPAAAAEVLSRRHGTVAVTLGNRGALTAHRGTVRDEIPAEPVEVVDSVGAGDAFTGGFLAACVSGAGLGESAAAGCRAAATAVARVGGRPPAR